MTKESGTWLRRFHPGPEGGPRLVCFPHAGGSAPYFHPVSRDLSPVLDVLAVQYPGRQERRHEPRITDIADLADALMAEIGPLADRPLAFFGHSMGAVVAFEVALRLRERGVTPVALFASGRRAPSAVREETLYQESDRALVA
ncbi:alpha/beta fold hydrolase, partial [Kitasatospora sp. NPDC050463]|uniref:thioesterase II family protein n=1 Tax=Kitasatospora sp. NPDC050463 TaxID=3155786 RepID=UPI0033F77B0B